MRSGDRPGLQNRRVAGNPVTGGFDPHSLPPVFDGLQPLESVGNQLPAIEGQVHYFGVSSLSGCGADRWAIPVSEADRGERWALLLVGKVFLPKFQCQEMTVEIWQPRLHFEFESFAENSEAQFTHCGKQLRVLAIFGTVPYELG